MGIVYKQSSKNIIFTYIGFIIGAINTIFLYTYFLSEKEYGLISYILSTSNILMPLMAFGVHQTFIKYYSSYNNDKEKQNFITLMLFLPIVMILLSTIITNIFYKEIFYFISKKNPEVGDYIYYILILSIIIAYFEVFCAWAKVHLRTTEGVFLREVFPRIFVFILLFGIYFQWYNFDFFIIGLLFCYFIRTIIMLYISFKIELPKLSFRRLQNRNSILKYSIFIILSGSISSLFIDIDKFMLNQYVSLNEIAVYTVSVFIATFIVVPQRSIYQIISPIVAKNINSGNKKELKSIYKDSTETIFLISGIIFVLILSNKDQIYALLSSKSYENGNLVLFFMCLIKLLDTMNTTGNAILFNSNSYKYILYSGIFLLLSIIGLNMIFIPKWGINGAVISSFISFMLYNIIKIYYVYKESQLIPFSKEFLRNVLFIMGLFFSFYYVSFPFIAIINILLKSVIIGIVSILLILKYNLSNIFSNIVRSKVENLKNSTIIKIYNIISYKKYKIE
ncbi:MAG: oligosaccharide flippase family protein [Capnocytophaga sp.]|nr:oligosaccharide flippase family protein [Capnocytophaga sp.]